MSQDTSSVGRAAVYTQTSDPGGNQIVAYARAGDGTLTPLSVYDTGGLSTGKPHLASQGSVVWSGDGRWLFAVNAGSDEISVFAVGSDGLTLVDRAGSGGAKPTSVTVRGDLVYVLSNGDESQPASLQGFRMGDDGRLTPVERSRRELSRPDADPAQIGFSPDGGTLIVTERATDCISTYTVAQGGFAEGRTVTPSAGATPYDFNFTRTGVVVVTEAAGGAVGAASASSYALSGGYGLSLISGSVGDARSEVCWAVVSPDDRHVYVTNLATARFRPTRSHRTVASSSSNRLRSRRSRARRAFGTRPSLPMGASSTRSMPMCRSCPRVSSAVASSCRRS